MLEENPVPTLWLSNAIGGVQSAKRLPIVGAAFNLHALLFFVAGGGLGWLLGLP